jgi:hypothetical protein
MDKNVHFDELDPDTRWYEYLKTSHLQIATPKVPIIAEYFRLVNDIFGAYLAIHTSLNNMVQMIGYRQEQLAKESNTTIEHMDKQLLMINKIDSHNPKPYPDPESDLHAISQGGFKKKNAPGGDNQIMAANMCIVMMYAYWEDNYREKIAHAAGFKSKNDVRSDIMHDLSILRNSIIHHKSYLKNDKKCKILTWFKPNDEISIDLSQFEEVKRQIEKGMSELSQELEKNTIPTPTDTCNL